METIRSFTSYTVQPGDNLTIIAMKFKMTLVDIQVLNNIYDPNKIQIGQILKVYGKRIHATTREEELIEPRETITYVTESQLNRIGWPSSNLTHPILEDLNHCLIQYDITTASRIRYFISQCSHESGAGLWTKELASGAAYEGRADLGNTQPGDGPKYKGGGYLQLTGRYNYTKFSTEVDDPNVLSIGADIVAAAYPWTSAGFWWHNNHMNSLCDLNPSVAEITRRVNGGYNGLADRQMYFDRCVEVIN